MASVTKDLTGFFTSRPPASSQRGSSTSPKNDDPEPSPWDWEAVGGIVVIVTILLSQFGMMY